MISNDRSVHATLSVVNASIYNKLQPFQNYVLDNNIMKGVITKTWLSNEENDLRYKEIPPPGYKIQSKPCKSGKEGAVLLWYTKLH